MSSLQHTSQATHMLEDVAVGGDMGVHDEEQWLGYEGMHPMTWLPAPIAEALIAAVQ